MNKETSKQLRNKRRAIRTRAKITGTAERPRLSVLKTNLYIAVQLIDDINKQTILGVHSKSLKTKGNKTEVARELGKTLAKQALEKNIKQVVFDRGACPYQGRTKAVAEGARENGLEF